MASEDGAEPLSDRATGNARSVPDDDPEPAPPPPPPGEPARRLHPFSWLFVLLTQLRTVAVPLVLLLVFGRGSAWELYGAIGAGVLALHSLVYSFSFRYRLGDGELLVREGLLNRTERHIPYARIQNIAQKRNPLHRLFGVTELRLESAGGGKSEAVMNVITLADAQRLEHVLRGSHADEPPTAGAPEVEALLTLPLREVLLLGLLGNRGMILVGALTAGLVWQLEWWEYKQVRDLFWMPGTALRELAGSGHVLGWVWTLAPLAAAFFVLLKLLSIAVALTSFHGFRLVRDGDRIATQAGLLMRHGASARADRIQRLIIGEGLLARLAARRWLSCNVAVGRRTGQHDASDQKHLKWLAPIARAERVEAILAAVDPLLSTVPLDWRPLHPRAGRRRFRRSLLVVSLGSLPAAWFLTPAIAAVGWALLVALSWFHARGWARFAAHACDGRVLAFRAGWLTRQWTVARIAKGQVLSLGVSPFDRRHGMARVQLDTAGAGRADLALDIPYLGEREARELAARLRSAME